MAERNLDGGSDASLSGPGATDDRSWSGRGVAVVGVNGPIGAATSRLFAGRGADLVLADHDAGALSRLATSLSQEGTTVRTVTRSGSPGDDASAVAGLCRVEWGKLDALILADVAIAFSLATALDEEQWHEVLDANLVAPAVHVAALIPLLRASEAGAVVLYGSIDGILGSPKLGGYSVARGGLVTLTHVLAHDCAPSVRVNCVAIGGIRELVTPEIADVAAPLIAATPLQRLASATEAARVAAFLASPDASYVTGAVVPVDGGRSALTPGTW